MVSGKREVFVTGPQANPITFQELQDSPDDGGSNNFAGALQLDGGRTFGVSLTCPTSSNGFIVVDVTYSASQTQLQVLSTDGRGTHIDTYVKQ